MADQWNGQGPDPASLPCAVLKDDISTEHGSFAKGSMYGVLTHTDQARIQQAADVTAVELDPPHTKVVLPGSYLQLIDNSSRELLKSVKKHQRLMILKDPQWLQDGKDMEVGDAVLLYNKKSLHPESGGILRYKGELHGHRGIYFGIELDPELKGKGSCDGTFRKIQYFRCEDDCALFETLYYVRSNESTGIPSEVSSLDIRYPPNAVQNDPHGDMYQPSHFATGSSSSNSILDKIDEAVEESENTTAPPPQMGLPPRPPPQQSPRLAIFPTNGNSSRAQQASSSGGQPRNSSYEQPGRQTRTAPKAGSGSTSISPMNLQEAGAGDASGVDSPLEVGERVVWVSDTGDHRGVVRWIGQPGELDEGERQVTAGVELDGPHGTGTGRYRGRDLFMAPKNHAALMPVMGLVKEDDFDGKSGIAAAPRRQVNQEDEDMKRAIKESLKEQERRSSSSGNSSRAYPSNDSSFPSIKQPPMARDQPESYMGEGARRKNTTPRLSQSSQPSSSPVVAPSLKPLTGNTYGLKINSRVKVLKDKYGVIKWIGKVAFGGDPNAEIAGILMDEPERTLYTAGTFQGTKYFESPPHRAFFSYLHKCKPDSRAPQLAVEQASKVLPRVGKPRSFGRSNSREAPSSLSSQESLVAVPDSISSLPQYVGKTKGIEGMAGLSGFVSLLYAWYQFTDALDGILYKENTQDDVPCYGRVRDILKNNIIKPLRVSGKVYADGMVELCDILRTFATDTMRKNISADLPEDYISLIVKEIFRCELIELSVGSGLVYLDIRPTTVPDVHFPTTERVLHAELARREATFRSVPSALHMVCRFERIHPLLEINTRDLVRGGWHACSDCQSAVASVQCWKCFHSLSEGGLAETFFCEACSSTRHSNPANKGHKLVRVESKQMVAQSGTLHLTAIICKPADINRFITYAKCHKGSEAPWVKFDSMASSISRNSGQKYIPEVSRVDDIAQWLTLRRNKDLAAMKRKDMPLDMQQICLHTHMCLYVKE